MRLDWRVVKLQPDLFWGALSTPKQEMFCGRVQLQARHKVMLEFGAALDMHTGRPKRSTAALAVSSTPSGADIELDGSFVGSTPSSISVSLGDHNIAIRKVGYQAWQRTIRVSGGTVNVNEKLDH